MAEIKSTMDLVMERAAKMAAKAPTVASSEEQEKEGMRLAADYLSGKLTDLTGELAKQQPKESNSLQIGAIRTLLRNVVLPRDEMLRERSDMALKGILSFAQNAGIGSLSTICAELQQILEQYNQHKEQVTQQVEDALRAQLEQQAAGQGIDPAQLTASMHPKYAEEMSKMNQDLNGQYNDAMDQRKDLILQQLGVS